MPSLGLATGSIAPVNPEEDPAFLSFLRAQGFEEDQLRAEVARRVGTLRRQAALQNPEFDRQEQQALQGVRQQHADRGTLFSGFRLAGQQSVADNAQRQRLAFNAGLRDQESDLYGNLASDVAAGRRRSAEEALNARSRLALDGANVGAL